MKTNSLKSHVSTCTKDLNVSNETIEKSANFEPESGMNPFEIQTSQIHTYFKEKNNLKTAFVTNINATLVIDCLKRKVKMLYLQRLKYCFDLNF